MIFYLCPLIIDTNKRRQQFNWCHFNVKLNIFTKASLSVSQHCAKCIQLAFNQHGGTGDLCYFCELSILSLTIIETKNGMNWKKNSIINSHGNDIYRMSKRGERYEISKLIFSQMRIYQKEISQSFGTNVYMLGMWPCLRIMYQLEWHRLVWRGGLKGTHLLK